jgi:hypothetical protein
MPRTPDPLTLAQAANRAADVVDPAGTDPLVGDFIARFEDRDEPISAIQESVQREVNEVLGVLDPEFEEPMLQMAGAVTIYLAFRRDEAGDNRADVLRLAAEAEYEGAPPPVVEDWLVDQGVRV